MKFNIALVFFVLVSYSSAGTPKLHFGKDKFKNFYGTIDAHLRAGDAGDPLIVTDYLIENKIEEAQKASEVTSDIFKDVISYSGYFRINDETNANIFFWFFPSQSNYETDPVVLWLQGGPGSTSMFGLFQENGPFRLVSDNVLEVTNNSWTQACSVIFIDQPVMTGWSFTNGKDIPTDQTKVGADLYKALIQFFTLFPQLQSNEFFITGESYGGKYVPAISYTILKNNPEADLKINLKGLAIGNGWTSPKHQLRYADYLLQHGFIDHNTRDIMFDLEQQAVDLINQERYSEANDVMGEDFGNSFSVFSQETGFSNVYNYLIEADSDEADIWLGNFFGRDDVRRAIHVGNQEFNDGLDVNDALSDDIPKSVASWVEELLENYRVVLYNGQLDLIVPYPVTIDYVRSLNFSSSAEYKTAKRNRWYVEDRLAGYSKTAGNLTEILVRNAGHMVPKDQPTWALDLIYKVTRNQPFI